MFIAPPKMPRPFFPQVGVILRVGERVSAQPMQQIHIAGVLLNEHNDYHQLDNATYRKYEHHHALQYAL